MHGHETEIKLKVGSAAAARRSLSRTGLVRIEPRHFERNFLFDFPDQRLRKSKCVVRLRHEGKRTLLTFKGPPLNSSRYKIRREIETEIADGSRCREILESLGLCPVFCYEKYRTTYAPKTSRGHHPRGIAVLDETPIGNYLELEGPQRWIDQLARRLGFATTDYVTASYVALYIAQCEAEGKRPGNMTFRAPS